MKELILSIFTVLVFIGCGSVEQKAQYNYISAEDTASLIRKSPEKIVLVDIQEKEDFEEEHLKGAKATYAYPVKTDEERASLTKLVKDIKPEQKVIVICPRGGGGADRAYDHLLSKGIKKDQLFTLTDGQYAWPRESIKDVLLGSEVE